MGNKVISDAITGDRKVVAFQLVDFKDCKDSEESGFDSAGNIIAHEVMDAYISGKQIFDSGGSGVSRIDKERFDKNYEFGHYEALKALPLMHTGIGNTSTGRIIPKSSSILKSNYKKIQTNKLVK